jgi:hypothetical protein
MASTTGSARWLTQTVSKGNTGQSHCVQDPVAAEEHTCQGHQAVSSKGSLWERTQGLSAKAGVLPDGEDVDQPGGRQGVSAGAQGHQRGEGVVEAHQGPASLEGG